MKGTEYSAKWTKSEFAANRWIKRSKCWLIRAALNFQEFLDPDAGLKVRFCSSNRFLHKIILHRVDPKGKNVC